MSLPQDIDDRRKNVMRLIKEFKAKLERMYLETNFNRRQQMMESFYGDEEKILSDFHCLFDHGILRDQIRNLVRQGHEIVISTVRTDEGKDTSPLIDNLERLQEIDRQMMAHQVDYLWHVAYEDDDGKSYTIYLGAGEVVDEWHKLWNETDDYHQTPKYSYILPPLKFARDFFLKHQDNPDLIQILGTNF